MGEAVVIGFYGCILAVSFCCRWHLGLCFRNCKVSLAVNFESAVKMMHLFQGARQNNKGPQMGLLLCAALHYGSWLCAQFYCNLSTRQVWFSFHPVGWFLAHCGKDRFFVLAVCLVVKPVNDTPLKAFAAINISMSFLWYSFKWDMIIFFLLQSDRCTANLMDRLPSPIVLLLLGGESMNKYSKAMYLQF